MKITIISIILIILLTTVFVCFFIKEKKKIVNTLKVNEKSKRRNKSLSKSWFMQTLRHYPCSIADFGLKEYENGVLYRKEDQSYWISKPLYDLGYGKEDGFCKLPVLKFDELVALAFDENVDNSDIACVMNHWGAVSVLADDYREEIKKYITMKTEQDESFKQKYKAVIEYIEADL